MIEDIFLSMVQRLTQSDLSYEIIFFKAKLLLVNTAQALFWNILIVLKRTSFSLDHTSFLYLRKGKINLLGSPVKELSNYLL